MASIYTTRELTAGVFMASINLRDAYLHIPVQLESRQYLRFSVKNKLKALYVKIKLSAVRPSVGIAHFYKSACRSAANMRAEAIQIP